MAKAYRINSSTQPNVHGATEVPIHPQVRQDSIMRSIVLHLLPGAILTTAYIATAPLALGAGFPAMVALLLCFAGLLIPFALGHLFYKGRQRNGHFSLQGIVLLQKRTSLRQALIIVPLVTVWSFVIYILMTPVESILIKTVFAWLPAWYTQPDLAHYPKSVLLITFALNFAINGLAGPVVEELYFRGYLLPRLARFGRWSPVISLCLFSLYHFWQPQQNITNLIALLPFICIVWKKQDVRLSILLHCTLNIVGILLTAALYLGH
jgi:membrane protease YdiL (CAAX protease family)